MLQRHGKQKGLLVLRVFFTREDFIWVHWQLLKLVGACSGERNHPSDGQLSSLCTSSLELVLRLLSCPCKSQLFHQDGKS